ncbi:L-threonine 3-dehydrogenase [Bacillus testis]|uniref:L-threonine 3-dehydrogenase n=1 Tax=Bacillus testis TaxID=1622072 RepID=UPI00067F566B|nr:L-threonine 3-dehydrogenase [Bacillus testis]
MNGKMKSLVKSAREYGARLEMREIPSVPDDGVLVKVTAASICGTDVHIYNWDDWAQSRVNPPYIFGHEFSGVVAEVGPKVTSVKVGEHVSAETHIVCGKCPQCLEGKQHVCKNTKIIGVDLPGSFAEYIVVPESNIWKNPIDMPFETASIQEPMGNAAHTVLSGEVLGKSVAIIGCGPIGIMAVAIAKAAGASKIIAIDINEYRLGLAAKNGADFVVDSSKENPVEKVNEWTDGNGIDVVCEMSGHPSAINQGFEMVTNGGRVSILSLPTKPVSIDLTNHVVFKGVTVQGITGRQIFKTWQQVSDLLATGKVQANRIITHHFPLEEFEKGFDLMIAGKCGKVVLHP